MAEAEIKTRTEKIVDGVTLTLSLEEAVALVFITGMLTGTGKIRSFTDNVYDALNHGAKLNLKFLDWKNVMGQDTLDVTGVNVSAFDKVIEKIKKSL